MRFWKFSREGVKDWKSRQEGRGGLTEKKLAQGSLLTITSVKNLVCSVASEFDWTFGDQHYTNSLCIIKFV